jgi:2-(1,2-epoxy-1,2-dihydrophenyl)acetyl-CoA isomerase
MANSHGRRTEERVELEDLLFERDGGVAIITLNRPQRMNAMTQAMTSGMLRLVRELRDDPETKVIVLTATGRAFCTGADVGGFAARTGAAGGSAPPPEPPPIRLHHAEDSAQLVFPKCDKPIIGAINGFAVGAGFGLALAPDIRIASSEAKFAVVQTKRGRRPDGGLNFQLPRIVGMQKALELMWTGEMIDAQEALRLGLVLRVVPHDDLMKETLEFAHTIAKGPSIAQALAKRMVYKTMFPESEHIASVEMEYYTGLVVDKTEDFREGVRAFMEKREPVFKGQ